MVVAPAAIVPVTFALPFTVSLLPPTNEPPPITAVARSVAPAPNVPVVVLPSVVAPALNVPATAVFPVVPSTEKRLTLPGV